MASQPAHQLTSNTAFKRKPIPVNVTPPTPVTGRNAVPVEDVSNTSCPRCGAGSSSHNTVEQRLSGDYAQRRIRELETEVKALSGKASHTADELANREQEIAKLRSLRDFSVPANVSQESSNLRDSNTVVETTAQTPNTTSDQQNTPPTRPTVPLGRALTTTRLTNFLSARRGVTSPVSPSEPTSPPAPSNQTHASVTADLTARLKTSESARRIAEEKLSKTNAELEELSVSLFSQANDMVAKERIAFAEREAQALERENTARDQEKVREQKAKEREVQWQELQGEMKARDKLMQVKVKRLEARVKILEERDKEKGKRLERLENALNRTGRIRGLLDAQSKGTVV